MGGLKAPQPVLQGNDSLWPESANLRFVFYSLIRLEGLDLNLLSSQ